MRAKTREEMEADARLLGVDVSEIEQTEEDWWRWHETATRRAHAVCWACNEVRTESPSAKLV